MIGRQEILDFAADFGLDPNVVEKDYVLGWLLAAIGAQREIGQEWLFKGGTCLKKCFFETYRFSEDLDFTSLNPAHIDEPFLSRVFREIADRLYEQAGIELPADTQRFEIYQNPRGRNSVQGRVGYRGPLGRQAGVPRIRLDVTADERVIMEADRREVHHPYSDRPARGFHVLTYRFEELFAEKIRALAERLRPRDLYDVVHLYRRDDSGADRVRIVETLKGKCEFKEIPVPTIAALRAHPELAALRNEWMTMLRHQLPQLPLFDDFWSELPGVFDWLFDVAKRPQAASMPFRPDIDTAWRAPAMGFAWRSEGISAPLEKIRFAAANRLCVDLLYRDESGRVGGRPIEPYSLRRTLGGELLLYAVRHADGSSRSYRVDRILDATVTQTPFVPKFAIEFGTSTPFTAPSVTQSSPYSLKPRVPALKPARAQRHASVGMGLTYVFECGFCGKKFSRKTYDSALNPHKSKDGWPCPGRTGSFVETRY